MSEAISAVELAQAPSLVEESLSNIREVSTLTEAQRVIVQTLYKRIKETSTSLLSDPSLDSSIKITQLIAYLMSLVENVHDGGKKIGGTDKKAVVLELGRLLLNDCIKDDAQRANMIAIYDVIAERMLEAMIDVSHVLNKHASKIADSCWDCLFSFCSKTSSTDQKKDGTSV